MRFVIFTHSLVSDWNHGNAHFLRGVATELVERGHTLRIFEPRNGWSLENLLAERGMDAVAGFEAAYPRIRSEFYSDVAGRDVMSALDDADVAIVHEWNSHELVKEAGERRRLLPNLRLFFHDTHHRSVTDEAAMASYDLTHYDGVLAYGGVIRDLYRERGWSRRAWTWHEAADTRVFYPRAPRQAAGDVVWIGNWGDDERSREIRDFLVAPVKLLGLKARVYGVRYPAEALEEVREAGIEYGGSLANYLAPDVFAQFRATVHIPRRPYARALPGIPTIRPFEALACGIPLISAPWHDSEALFRPGVDYLEARDGYEMAAHLQAVLYSPGVASQLARNGLETIRARHTCAHRVDELMAIVASAREVQVAEGAH